MNRKILVLGYFGYITNQLDGQTIKTRNLFLLLKKKGENVDYFDTQDFKKSKFTFFILLYKLFLCDKVYYLPAYNNLKFIFPLLFILSKLLRFDILYFVVGGWLPDFIKGKKVHIYFLRKIKFILSETKKLKQELKDRYNIKNVVIFPNFKFYNELNNSNNSSNIRIVFLSRINKKKGLDFLFNLSGRFSYNDNVELMCFGPVNEEDRAYFESELVKYPNLKYGGLVSFENVIKLLSTFDMFIFPTKYYTEGLPGVIVEAYFAGIPVIATNWKYASEFIIDGKSGFICEWEDFEDFYRKVNILVENPNRLKEMKEFAKAYGKNYSEVGAWEILKSIENI